MYQIASCSKFITSLMVAKLYELGKIDYDTDINIYLKKWKCHVKGVTLRHLLTHTSDSSDYNGFLGIEPQVKYTQNLELNIKILNGESYSKPFNIAEKIGKKFMYSGAGFQVIQRVIEEITNKRLYQLMKQYIFAPLDMKINIYIIYIKMYANDIKSQYHPPNISNRTTPIRPYNDLENTVMEYARLCKSMPTNNMVKIVRSLQKGGKIQNIADKTHLSHTTISTVKNAYEMIGGYSAIRIANKMCRHWHTNTNVLIKKQYGNGVFDNASNVMTRINDVASEFKEVASELKDVIKDASEVAKKGSDVMEKAGKAISNGSKVFDHDT